MLHGSICEKLKKTLSVVMAFLLSVTLTFSPGLSYAQTASTLPAPGALLNMTPAFTPAYIKGMTVHPENPFHFDFIVNTGDTGLQGDALKAESTRLIKYFLAALTTPEEEMWVNLSPYERDRIVPKAFGETVMGKDLLALDYLLKQLSSSLTNPENTLGKDFWQKIYTQAQAQFGTTDIPMDTFHKIWIVPQDVLVYEHKNSAFVVRRHLKVMLEDDYIALQKGMGIESFGLDSRDKSQDEAFRGVSAQIARELLVPAVEKEVNEGQTFANLRQIYNSMIMAAWYKKNLRNSLLGQVYVNRHKNAGVDSKDKDAIQNIYAQYVEAFKKGVYNYIKEDYDPAARAVLPRKYFSGGIPGVTGHDLAMTTDPSQAKNLAADSTQDQKLEVKLLNIDASEKDPAKANASFLTVDPSLIQHGLLKGLPNAVKMLENKNIRGETFLLRLNLNVPTKTGANGEPVVTDTTRYNDALSILEFLLNKGAKIIVIGHNGRFEAGKDSRKSVEPAAAFFQKELQKRNINVPVTFHKNSITAEGLAITRDDLFKNHQEKNNGSIDFLENLRFAPEHEQGKKDSEKRITFAKGLTALADNFIFDAPADIASPGASVEDLAKLFVQANKKIAVGPSAIKEIGDLPTSAENILALITGGSKEDKLAPIAQMVKKVLTQWTRVFLGSATTASLNKLSDDLKTIFTSDPRVIKTIDYGKGGNASTEGTFDIGPETIALFSKQLRELAKSNTNPNAMILVNGTMGWVENPLYSTGTQKIFELLTELVNTYGIKVVFFGGDATANAKAYALDKLDKNKQDNIIFLTGGGLLLKTLAGVPIVGIEALHEAMKIQPRITGLTPVIISMLTPISPDKFNEILNPVIDQTERHEGGINLNAAMLDMQIKKDAAGGILPLEQQPVFNMKIEGLVPVIINVTPATNLPDLLGLKDADAPVGVIVKNS